MNVPSTFCTRAFGHPGLDVMHGAERAMSLWPNKGEPDRGPPLGSGYVRIDTVMPRRQSCLRALPEYPY
jgi:cholesterol oxidase